MAHHISSKFSIHHYKQPENHTIPKPCRPDASQAVGQSFLAIVKLRAVTTGHTQPPLPRNPNRMVPTTTPPLYI